jgi:hypothetical protein
MMLSVFVTASLLAGALPLEGTPPAGPVNRLRIGTNVGDLHPLIALPSLDGKRALSLSQFRGKKVLLVQFASW